MQSLGRSVFRPLRLLLRQTRQLAWPCWSRISRPWAQRPHAPEGTLEPLAVTVRIVRESHGLCLSSYQRLLSASIRQPDTEVSRQALYGTHADLALARCARLGSVTIRMTESGVRSADHIIVVAEKPKQLGGIQT